MKLKPLGGVHSCESVSEQMGQKHTDELPHV